MNLSRLLTALLLTTTVVAQAQISLNEFLASNNAVNQDPTYQAFSDWVEIHNSGNSAVDLSAWWLSDDADILDKWTFPAGASIPANGYLLVWADGQNTGLHTNFKLSADGEKIILSNPLGNEVDKFSFGPQLTDVSQGRQVNGTGAWVFFTKPTPGASNTTSPFFEDYVKPVPYFSLSGGFFANPVTVNIQNLSSSGAVHYTTDGSEPTTASPVFTQPQTFALNTVVKARIIVPNRISGPVVTNTYFVGEDFQQRGLAVLSLSGDPDDFFSGDSGILVQNYKPLWEIPIHLEFYENDGLLGFHHDAGASVGGENSWILPQKLLNISSRKQYGGGHIEYQIFPDRARTRYEDLILRTSGNDWSNTLFRDGMMQGTAGSTSDLDVQAFRPVATFINGQYYGIYNLREKQDKEYAEIHRGIPADSLDYIENDAEIKEGDAVAYQQMVALLNAGVQSDAAFQNLAKICDTQNFTDYIISEIFTANTSWGHNIALFRKRSPDAQWRWFPHDYDRGFNLSEVGGTGMAWATATNGLGYSNPPFATLFLRKMLQNNAFKENFITRFADHLFVTWNPQWVNPRIDRHANWIKNEVPYHVGKWAGTTSSYGNGIASVQFWQQEVAKLKAFDQQRNAFMFSDLTQFFGLSTATGLTVQVSDPAQGQVRLHDLPALPAYPWTGKYFQNRPFTLTAEAKPGFNFVRWEKTLGSGTAQTIGTDAVLNTSISGSSPVTLRAVFESNGDCGILPDTLRQNLTLTPACSPYTAAGDVVVLPSVTLTVEDGVEIRFPAGADLWVLGDLQINGTENSPVKIISIPGGAAWGGILLKNTTAKSTLKYLTLENASAGIHRIYFPAAISAYHADLDLDHLTLTNVTDNPIFARFSDVTLTNSELRSVVTGDGINVKQGKGRVENCTFTALGTVLPDMDAIDFDGVTDGLVRNNIIHDFRGDNCDGLDIGEQCQNLQIEDNFIYHCFDKGISVGQQSSVTIRNNTIAYTAIGIALKDQSPVTVDHCTLFGNQSGISAYEKNPGSLGGNGIITNCIVSNAAFDAYIADSLSSLSLSSCLSGTDTLSGPGNQTADPRFVNPTRYDFHLLPGSPALGAGTNGADLGASPLPTYTGQPQVMLSEILYNDTLTTTGEFLEVHNPGTQPIDLGGYTLTGAVDFIFPVGAGIAPGEYLVVAKNAADFPPNAAYQVFQWTSGKLADEGEKILLFDATGLLSDFVRYNNHAPWPEGATLLGKSLELVSADLDNHFASSWQPSSAVGGSPGKAGVVVAIHSPVAPQAEVAVFPNPAGDFVNIAVKNAVAGTLLLQISDLNGRVVFSEKTNSTGSLLVEKVELARLAAGAYFVRVLDAGGVVLGVERLVLKHL